jgi:endonuclease YncB( thermonuclease family)
MHFAIVLSVAAAGCSPATDSPPAGGSGILSQKSVNRADWPVDSRPAQQTAVADKSAIIDGRVITVADGDTLTVLDASNARHKIRLQGIDSPEDGQAFGRKARKALADKVLGKDVRVKWHERDRYDRIVGAIYVGERFINREMIAEGWGWHLRQHLPSKELADDQAAAKKQRKGKPRN